MAGTRTICLGDERTHDDRDGIAPAARGADAVASLAWVRAFSRRPDCAAAIANHDAAVRPGSLG